VVARSSDGLVEAVEDPSVPFLLGVQWHPEVREDAGLFQALVEAAGGRA
jgi:putative glutamine amidotransferase